MQSRANTLERIRSLYGVMTHVRELALHHAGAAVHEAETYIAEQKAMVKRLSEESLIALDGGDSQGWQMYESQRTFMQRDATRLVALRDEREAETEAAKQLYQEQRMQLEQIESVVDGLRLKMAVAHSRREQQDSDDRFLMRQRWLGRRAQSRMNHS